MSPPQSPRASSAQAAAHRRRALWIALIANSAFLVAEVAGGLIFGSLALLADAAHMLSDVAGLGVALVAERLATLPATGKHSYGLQRAEVLGAQINALALLGASVWIVVEALDRIGNEIVVEGLGVLVVASLGLAINVISAIYLARASGESLNMKAAVRHMLADAAASVGVIAAAVVVLLWGAYWVDPAISVVIALLVLVSGWSLLKETTHVLLEGTPRGIDPDAVREALTTADAVVNVHHLHIWNLASHTPALSAHLRFDESVTLHDAQVRLGTLKTLLAQSFGIEHATIEVECHECEDGLPVCEPGVAVEEASP